MPIFGKPGGSPLAVPSTTTSTPVAKAARRRVSRRVLCVIVGVLPLGVSLGSDIGLAHDGLCGERASAVHPHLGHHSAGSWLAVVRQSPPVSVLEVVDVVGAFA